MTLKYGMFNNSEGDIREYTAEDWARIFSLFFTNGVKDGTFFVSGSGRNANVQAGYAHIKGYYLSSDAVETITIAENTSGLPRIDRIIIRLNLTNRIMEIAKLQGTPGMTPTAPSLTRNSTIHEISLAQARINNGGTSLILTDERGLESVCGYIKADVSIPVNEMWLNWTEELADVMDQWEAWFDNRTTGIAPTFFYSETEPEEWVAGDIWGQLESV